MRIYFFLLLILIADRYSASLLYAEVPAISPVTQPCPVPRCPSFTGAVNTCSCGEQLFQRKKAGEGQYCCGEASPRLQKEPCSTSLEAQREMEKVFCSVPELASKSGLIVGYQLEPGVRVGVHRALVPILDRVQRALKKVPYRLTSDETVGFNPRPVRSGEENRNSSLVYSTHAFGIAIDVNWNTNPYCPLFPSVGRCKECESGLESDLPPEFIEAFEAHGFEWGGRWSVPDPMHFELRRAFWPVEGCAHWREKARAQLAASK